MLPSVMLSVSNSLKSTDPVIVPDPSVKVRPVPPVNVIVPPKETSVVLVPSDTVIELLLNAEFGILVRVLDPPSIDLLVIVSVEVCVKISS